MHKNQVCIEVGSAKIVTPKSRKRGDKVSEVEPKKLTSNINKSFVLNLYQEATVDFL